MKRVIRPSDPWSGQISLPGGHSNPEDNSPVDTARRETLEEVGLELPLRPVGQLDDVHPKNPMLPPIIIRPYVFVTPEKVPFLRVGDEASIEIRAGIVKLPELRRKKTVQAGGFLLSVSGFQLGPHFVWGLTERVINGLLRIIDVA